MGIHEMHVAIDVWLQKINSNSRRNIQPEEKDMVLNSVIQDYVSSKIKQSRPYGEFGFHNDTIDADAISSLLRQFVPVSVFPSKRPGLLEIHAPSDFRNFITLSAQTAPFHCMTEAEKEIPITEDITIYLYTFKVPTLSGVGPYYKDVALNWGGEVYRKTSEGTSDPYFQRFVYNALIQDIPGDVHSIYWQKVPTRLEQKNTIIVASYTELASLPTLELGGVVIPSMKVTLTQQRVNRNAHYSNTFTADSRRIKPQYIHTVQDSAFERSTFKNVVLTIEDDLILIPDDNKFLVTIGALSYVKKPAEVSLSLGIDCDLPDRGSVHEYICQKAAEELLLTIDSPSWQARFETNKIKK